MSNKTRIKRLEKRLKPKRDRHAEYLTSLRKIFGEDVLEFESKPKEGKTAEGFFEAGDTGKL